MHRKRNRTLYTKIVNQTLLDRGIADDSLLSIVDMLVVSTFSLYN